MHQLAVIGKDSIALDMAAALYLFAAKAPNAINRRPRRGEDETIEDFIKSLNGKSRMIGIQADDVSWATDSKPTVRTQCLSSAFNRVQIKCFTR